MLYVGIWYVSIRPVVTRVKEERIETYQTATYSIRTLLKVDYWSPKHVELLNVTNKINHQILCILLDYRYIAKWYTDRTISKQLHTAYTTAHQPTQFLCHTVTFPLCPKLVLKLSYHLIYFSSSFPDRNFVGIFWSLQCVLHSPLSSITPKFIARSIQSVYPSHFLKIHF